MTTSKNKKPIVKHRVKRATIDNVDITVRDITEKMKEQGRYVFEHKVFEEEGQNVIIQFRYHTESPDYDYEKFTLK